MKRFSISLVLLALTALAGAPPPVMGDPPPIRQPKRPGVPHGPRVPALASSPGRTLTARTANALPHPPAHKTQPPHRPKQLGRLPLEELAARTAAVRRQLALGHGAEFTSAEVDQGQLLRYCDDQERLVALAQATPKDVGLL